MIKFCCKFSFLVAVLFLNYGCAIREVQTPKIPPVPVAHIREPSPSTAIFQPPVTKNVRYVEKEGKSIRTEDNVSVRVTSIVDKLENDKFLVTIEGPDGASYKYSIFPMMLVLEIKNDTDHILTLRRTVITLEDEKQVPYPLINTLEENKRRLANDIGNAFDKYMADVRPQIETSEALSTVLAQYREVVFGSYKADYDRMVKEVHDGHGFLTEGVRTPDVEKGSYLTEEGERQLFEKYAPENVYSRGAAELDQAIQQKASALLSKSRMRRTEMDALREKAVHQVMGLPTIDAVITGGEYLPISILPGRAKEIIAPFSKRNSNEDIKSIMVGIYDLPTKVNEAGDPIKRTNFTFHMVAETTN